MLMYLLNATGVPTEYVIGHAEGVPHAWNRVEIGGEMYNVDITWADHDDKQLGTFINYFNETDEYFSQTHSWDRESYPEEAKSDTYNFMNVDLGVPNLYKVENSEDLIPIR